MKKKGLIISTVVMVVVLIASLTTATYAWFTTSDRTTIDGFTVEVVSGNAVNIGLKVDNTYTAGAMETAFVSGDCKYTPNSTEGALGGGKWDGTEGLSATINHNIVWGAQSKAVGVTTQDTVDAATLADTLLWNVANGKKAIAANLGKDNKGVEILDNKSYAVANQDYAYLFLGALPTKELTSNELVVAVDASQSTNIGILAALHVAYRLNSNGEWNDVAIFGDDDTEGSIHYNQKSAQLTTNLTDKRAEAYQAAYDKAPSNGVYGIGITLKALKDTDAIDQIEIVVYIAGDDDDCIDQAKGSNGEIKIFFNAVAKPQQAGE